MKVEKIDMSPEAITNRLKTMEQLWELSVSLMKAKPLQDSKENNSESILLRENSRTFEKMQLSK